MTIYTNINEKDILYIIYSCVYLGLVIGIEDDSFGLWMNALATSLHKFVMAFSIGVDLVCSQVTSDVSITILLKCSDNTNAS